MRKIIIKRKSRLKTPHDYFVMTDKQLNEMRITNPREAEGIIPEFSYEIKNNEIISIEVSNDVKEIIFFNGVVIWQKITLLNDDKDIYYLIYTKGGFIKREDNIKEIKGGF